MLENIKTVNKVVDGKEITVCFTESVGVEVLEKKEDVIIFNFNFYRLSKGVFSCQRFKVFVEKEHLEYIDFNVVSNLEEGIYFRGEKEYPLIENILTDSRAQKIRSMDNLEDLEIEYNYFKKMIEFERTNIQNGCVNLLFSNVSNLTVSLVIHLEFKLKEVMEVIICEIRYLRNNKVFNIG